jgi:hypothetical protein
MAEPSSVEFAWRLGNGFALDRLWRETMGLPPGDTKEQPLRSVISVLEASGTRYALIGGVAMQLYSREPRTTLDIDLAVTKYDQIPSAALTTAGFVHEGRHPHSDNWRAPGAAPRDQRTAIQFFSSEDVGIEDAVARARIIDAGGFQLRLAMAGDLLVLKLAAAEEPRRPPSKRRQDLLDIITLAEEHPSAALAIPQLPERIERLGSNLLTLGLTRGPER